MLQAMNLDPAVAGPLTEVPPLAQALVDAHRNGLSLTEAFTGIVHQLGFDSFTYGISTVAQPTRASRTLVWTNAPREWIAEYEAQAYIEVDPRAELARTANAPRFWDQNTAHTPQQRIFLRAAERFGIGSGVILSLYMPTGLSSFWFNRALPLWGTEEKAAAATKLPAMAQLAHFAHHYLLANVAERHLPSVEPVALSPREREVLQAIARGKSAAEIAKLLGIAEPTVQTYVRQLLEKLGASNRHEAVAAGVKAGLIDC